ncbi:MAG: ribonuclease H-like YkuK family protein [Candidatus Liptonbacteria bacterium]|nr:ribonuclease H-like YkuK family protein [Candidatus Liptonbacteria bacterium]
MFHAPDGSLISLSEAVGEVVAFMKRDDSRSYKIIIGTDSLITRHAGPAGGLPGQGAFADFVTAIVVHRVGNGGRYFWKKIREEPVFNLRDRIIKEALYSIDMARDVNLLLGNAESPAFSFEIHADIGVNGPTKELISEVVGMIRANNFPCFIKPFSFGASTVADRHA